MFNIKLRHIALASACLLITSCTSVPTDTTNSSTVNPSVDPSTSTTDETSTPSVTDPSISIPSVTDPSTPTEEGFKNLDVNNYGQINWFGRTYSEGGKEYFHYSSSGFEVKFYGTRLIATIGATEHNSDKNRPYIAVFIDGEDDPRKATTIALDKAEGDYMIAENLEEGFHTIRVLKISESQYSKCYLKSVSTDGEFYTPPAKKERKIEVYGASTTCGFGVFGLTGPEAFRTETESSLFSFAGLTSRVFDAEYNLVSASGWAITQNKASDGVSMLDAYDQVDLKNPMPWDFDRFVPDLVMINLATNDSVYIDDAPTIEEREARETRYYNGYIQFIENLRAAYDNPELPVLMIYGFLDDQGVEGPIKDIKAHYAAKGDAYVDFQKVYKANATDGFGSSYHASALTHIRSTDVVVPKVIELKDREWDIVHENITTPKL